MYRRIFKQSGSRVYRLRYRIGDDLRVYDVPLHTSNLEVAQAKADEIISDAEKAALGIGFPRPLRDALKRPAADHLAEHITHMEGRGRSKAHVRHARVRLQRLFADCRWRYLSDVTADRFLAWRAENEDLSQKTRNEYLAHANAFFNWMLKQDRILNNPLRGVFKMETRGNETFQRRALSFPEVGRLITGTKRRGFLYLVAIGTGLRRNELKQLLWPDLILEGPKPVVRLRAETTKAKRADEVPIVPVLGELLQAAKKKASNPAGLVFPCGISRPKTLAKDLEACGIEVEDEHGCRVDFHALRHTYTTLMGDAGVSELARVKLARHRSWKLTDRYTDSQRLPLHAEMGKFGDALASSIASQKSGKTWPNQGNVVQVAAEPSPEASSATADTETVLVGATESTASEKWRSDWFFNTKSRRKDFFVITDLRASHGRRIERFVSQSTRRRADCVDMEKGLDWSPHSLGSRIPTGVGPGSSRIKAVAGFRMVNRDKWSEAGMPLGCLVRCRRVYLLKKQRVRSREAVQ